MQMFVQLNMPYLGKISKKISKTAYVNTKPQSIYDILQCFIEESSLFVCLLPGEATAKPYNYCAEQKCVNGMWALTTTKMNF